MSTKRVQISFIDISSQSGPFPNRNWKDAKISLNFETMPDLASYVNKDEGSREEWRVFQTHRRTLGVKNTPLLKTNI